MENGGAVKQHTISTMSDSLWVSSLDFESEFELNFQINMD